MAAKTQGAKIEVEHIQFLTGIFQEIRTENYMHDYDGDYKIIGMALKRAKEYDMVVLMELMEYFKQHGLKEVKSMQGWLIWAFKNPKTAMQPFNTIDLQKKRGAVNGAQQESKRATSRDYYEDLFNSLDGSH